MYTVVLMAAISAGEANPRWVGHHSYATPYHPMCAGSIWDGHPGYGAFGCIGCYGGDYGGYPSAGYVTGWPGAYGPYNGYYGGYVNHSTPAEPPSYAPLPTPAVAPPVAPPMPPKTSLDNKVRSRVIIDIPENAKLYVDGRLMHSASTHRVLQTPDLTPGATYLYDLKIELVREGQTLTEEKRIYFRAGVDETITFREPAVRSDIARSAPTASDSPLAD